MGLYIVFCTFYWRHHSGNRSIQEGARRPCHTHKPCESCTVRSRIVSEYPIVYARTPPFFAAVVGCGRTRWCEISIHGGRRRQSKMPLPSRRRGLNAPLDLEGGWMIAQTPSHVRFTFRRGVAFRCQRRLVDSWSMHILRFILLFSALSIIRAECTRSLSFAHWITRSHVRAESATR